MYSGFSVARKKLGTTYRKTIGVYNYKIGHQKYHKEPGAVDLHTVETLKKVFTRLKRLDWHLVVVAEIKKYAKRQPQSDGTFCWK